MVNSSLLRHCRRNDQLVSRLRVCVRQMAVINGASLEIRLLWYLQLFTALVKTDQSQIIVITVAYILLICNFIKIDWPDFHLFARY